MNTPFLIDVEALALYISLFLILKYQISNCWKFHMIICQINRLLLEDDTALENHNSECYTIIKEFRAFLSDCKDVLDEATTMKLLERLAHLVVENIC